MSVSTDGGDAAGVATGEGGDTAARAWPWYRNPFLVAFVAGAITLTGLRWRLRYIPQPPPTIGAVELAGHSDANETALESGERADGVLIVAFADATTPRTCGGVHLTHKLWHVFRGEGVEVGFVTVAVGAATTPKELRRVEHETGGARDGWTVVGAVDDDAAGSALDGLRAAMEEWSKYVPTSLEHDANDGRSCGADPLFDMVAIVDPQRRWRGFYSALDVDAASEVFHRARHVLGEERDPNGL